MDDDERKGESEFVDDETKAVRFEHTLVTGTKSAEEAYLIVLSGSHIGTMVKVTDGLTIGRGPRAGFRCTDEGVSRSHVRIVETLEGVLFAEDLGSRNGTFVNGERIDRVRLKDGDKIQMGSITILKFSYADKLEETFQQQMYDAALRDPLTKLFNRRHFEEQFLSEFAYAVRHMLSLSLIILDLDHFKRVNDTYGHPTGDVVLVAMGSILEKSIRQEDLFARYGGEEFALLCRDTAPIKAFAVADRIRCAVEKASMDPEHPELKLTISAGVAGIPDAAMSKPEDLVDATDKALYRAKALGRNRVFLHDPDLQDGDLGPVQRIDTAEAKEVTED